MRNFDLSNLTLPNPNGTSSIHWGVCSQTVDALLFNWTSMGGLALMTTEFTGGLGFAPCRLVTKTKAIATPKIKNILFQLHNYSKQEQRNMCFINK